jgi:predicted nucleic acid-binding protein
MRPLYLLDTCIISEPIKPEPSEPVLKKLREHEGLTAISYDEHSAWIHSAIRVRLEKEGISLSFADGQIAATAVAHNMILVTRNEEDFKPVSNLNLENWFPTGL